MRFYYSYSLLRLFFVVCSTCFRIRMISASACWCPVAVLGCAAMISWTWAARLVPIHPWHSGSSGISWRMYLRSRVHFFIQRVPFASPAPLSSGATVVSGRNPPGLSSVASVVGGRNPPRKNTIAIIPNIPQYPGLYLSLP